MQARRHLIGQRIDARFLAAEHKHPTEIQERERVPRANAMGLAEGLWQGDKAARGDLDPQRIGLELLHP